MDIMSRERKSEESSKEELANEDSDATVQNVASVNCGISESFSQKTLDDLPVEMLQLILIESVAMEVDEMKMAKCVWKEKADLVISRLRTVCPNWNSVLTSEFFRNELHRTLDGIPQLKIQLDILHQTEVDCIVLDITSLDDEMFLVCGQWNDDDSERSFTNMYFNVSVYNRNNMAQVKDVIALYSKRPGSVAACNVAKCVYVLYRYVRYQEERELNCSSIVRFQRNEENHLTSHPWITDLASSIPSMSVSVKGCLVILSRPDGSEVVSIYNLNGFLERSVILSPVTHGFLCVTSVFQKSNGNLVLAWISQQQQFKTVITEINTNGIVQRKYKTPLARSKGVAFSGLFEWMIIQSDKGSILVDSELNALDFTGPSRNAFKNSLAHFHYNGETDEVVGIRTVRNETTVLTFFRFREE